MNMLVLLLSTGQAVARTDFAPARVKDLTKPEKLSLSPEKDSSVEHADSKISEFKYLPLIFQKYQNSHQKKNF